MILSDVRLRVITICTNHGEIHPKTKETVKNLQNCEVFKSVEAFDSRGSNIEMARNTGVNKNSSDFRTWQKIEDFDYILFLDADNELPVKNVINMIERDVDILCAAYIHRSLNDSAVAGLWDTSLPIGAKSCLLTMNMKGLVEVDFVGGGALLIKNNVFNTMPYPWFDRAVVKFQKSGIEYSVPRSSDWAFCLKAKELGYKIYCDMDNRSYHFLDWRGTEKKNIFKDNKPISVDELNLNAKKLISKLENEVDSVFDVLRELLK